VANHCLSKGGAIIPAYDAFGDILLVLLIICASVSAGCISGRTTNGSPEFSGSSGVPSGNVSAVMSADHKQVPVSGTLAVGQAAVLHTRNMTLSFSILGKNRDPSRNVVLLDMEVRNIGTVPVTDIQSRHSYLYATDRYGQRYMVPTHVALMGLAPGEMREGSIEIVDVPEQALPGLVFTYRFGEEEASWLLVPETVP